MLTYGFYNSVNGDRRYNANQFSDLFTGIITDGIFTTIGDVMNITPYSGMRVSLGTGRAWFNKTWTNIDSTMVLTLDPSEIVLNRIDAIILEVDTSLEVRENRIRIIKGTPSSTPVRPTLTHTEYINQYPLAYIYIPQAASEITQGNITNMIGTSECPYVTGILETVDENTLSIIHAYVASLTDNVNEITDYTYVDDLPKTITSYWEDGTTIKMLQRINYVDGVVSNTVIEYYDKSGTIQSTTTETYTLVNGNITRKVKVIS